MTTTLAFKAVEGWEQLPKEYRHKSVTDVAVDSRDRIYVYTRDRQRVLVYERDGTFVNAWEGKFPGRAHGITVGPDDFIYCANDVDHTVRKFTPDGELLMTLGTSGVPGDSGYNIRGKTLAEKNASVVRGAPPFNRPTKAAVAPGGDVYVSDGYGNARVHRFSADGRLIRSWGEPGSGPGQFVVPHGVGVAADGRVLVADRENNRIQVFTPDGDYLDQWTGFSRPTSLFVHRSGWIYVSEIGWEADPDAVSDSLGEPLCVRVLDDKGNVLARWQSAEDGGLGRFAAPHGLCVDSRGDIYIASNNRRGRKYTSSAGIVLEDYYSLEKFARQA